MHLLPSFQFSMKIFEESFFVSYTDFFMSKLNDNLKYLGIAIGALLFLFFSAATQACAVEGHFGIVPAMSCCQNETPVSATTSGEQCCQNEFHNQGRWKNCDCVTRSSSVVLWQNPFFSPDFIESSHRVDFAFRETDVAFTDVQISAPNLLAKRFSSRAPPVFFF